MIFRTIAVMLLGLTTVNLTATSFDTVAQTSRPLAPARLAIYYGYPSLVNGAAGNVEKAAATFAAYQMVVLGDGLEFDDVDARRRPVGAGPDEHRRTRLIIERLRQQAAAVEIYGYVDLGNSQKLPMDEITRRVRLWAAMGVTGIFLDEAGYDFGVTRERQNEVVQMIHSHGLNAFLNAFNPDDVFGDTAVPLNGAGGGNPNGVPARLGAQDVFLLESFQVRLGEPEAWSVSATRTARALSYRDRFSTRIAAVTTTTTATASGAADLFAYAWWSAALWGLDGFGWGEPDFSGPSSQLPARHQAIDTRALNGARFTSPVIETPAGFERRTNGGRIFVRRAGHQAGYEPIP